MHHHRLILGLESVEEGFLRLAFQISSTKHIGVKLLQFHSDLKDSFIIVLGGFSIPLLNAIQLVQECSVGGSATVDLV